LLRLDYLSWKLSLLCWAFLRYDDLNHRISCCNSTLKWISKIWKKFFTSWTRITNSCILKHLWSFPWSHSVHQWILSSRLKIFSEDQVDWREFNIETIIVIFALIIAKLDKFLCVLWNYEFDVLLKVNSFYEKNWWKVNEVFI
jgi:hypothetical protein